MYESVGKKKLKKTYDALTIACETLFPLSLALLLLLEKIVLLLCDFVGATLVICDGFR